MSTLLSVIGEDAVKVLDTFTWGEDEKDDSIKDVLAKPRTQVIYERHHFNNRKQEASERIATYVTELRMIAKTVHKSDEILRDRLVLGIRDEKVQERLLRFGDLTSQKAIDTCKAAKQTSQQLKLMRNVTKDSVVLLDKSPENHVIHLTASRMQILWVQSWKSPVPCI